MPEQYSMSIRARVRWLSVRLRSQAQLSVHIPGAHSSRTDRSIGRHPHTPRSIEEEVLLDLASILDF